MNNKKNKLLQDSNLKKSIERLYIQENLNKKEVAKRLDLSVWTLSNLIKGFGLQKDFKAIVKTREQTFQNKYGSDVTNASNLKEVKEKIGKKVKSSAKEANIKRKETKLSLYGDSNYNNIEKNKQTKLKHFGDINYNNRDKYKKTMIDKFGVDNGFKLIDTKENIEQNILNNKNYSNFFKELFLDRDKSIEFLKDKNYTYFDLMNIFNAPYYTVQVWATRLDLKKFINFKFEGKSHYEDEIVSFINSLGFNTITHDRKILKGQELDIYIPEKRVAIEFNGTYWHEESKVGKLYHFNKSYQCEQNNIRLIHIYEYQWQDAIKKEILRSIIRNSLGVNTNIIYARKCEIKELSKKDVEEFSNLNSLHQHRNASIYIGLFYNNELVELVSFGKAFFSQNNNIQYECIRSITKINTTVIGGMSKLFNYFIKKYNPINILYYVDYNTHNGNSMNKLNFKFISYSKGGMINVSNSKETIDKYGLVFGRRPDKYKEIKEYIEQGKIFTIYDAGVKKYIWTKEEKGK